MRKYYLVQFYFGKLESVYGFGGPPINLGIPWEPLFNWKGGGVSIKSKI